MGCRRRGCEECSHQQTDRKMMCDCCEATQTEEEHVLKEDWSRGQPLRGLCVITSRRSLSLDTSPGQVDVEEEKKGAKT